MHPARTRDTVSPSGRDRAWSQPRNLPGPHSRQTWGSVWRCPLPRARRKLSDGAGPLLSEERLSSFLKGLFTGGFWVDRFAPLLPDSVSSGKSAVSLMCFSVHNVSFPTG